MSPPASQLLDPVELPERLLVVASGPAQLRHLLEGPVGDLVHVRARKGEPLDLRVLVRRTDEEEGEWTLLGRVLRRHSLPVASEGAHEPGSLSALHGLAEELELRMSADHPGVVIAAWPEPGADSEDRAVAAAMLAGLRASARRCLLANWTGEAPLGHRLVHFAEHEGAPLLDVGSGHLSGLVDLRREGPEVTAVLSSFNKCSDVRANLRALRAQTRPFAQIVVVDNASHDGSAAMVAKEFPEVDLVVMPNSAYGACETFNIGFACATSEYIAILDDDVVLPPEWVEKTTARMLEEPETTAIVSTKIIEPGMPDSYRNAEGANRERYMSTFRGCASLARRDALEQAGYYDERLFIYGNERDLTCRLLNLGYRVLQYPGVETFHKTPFGVQMGKRSLYYHARNAWLGMLKYAPLEDLVRLPWLVVTKVLLRSREEEAGGEVTDAVGTIGIGESIRNTKGSYWVLAKALASVIANVPYCLKHRQPCKAPDFELPIR